MKKTLIGWLLDNKDVAYPGIYKPEGDNWIPCTITYSEDEWEDVEVVRMYCPECQTVMTKKEHEQNNCCKNAVELRGTYRRRKPEPEPQVWEGMAKYTIDGAVIFTPKEFAGKRVRVEVIP